MSNQVRGAIIVFLMVPADVGLILGVMGPFPLESRILWAFVGLLGAVLMGVQIGLLERK